MKIFITLLFISLVAVAQPAQDLCKQLLGDGSGKDAKARTELMKITHNAAKSDGDVRSKHEAVILSALQSSSSFEVSTFLIQQLDLCGGKASLPQLAKLLNHTELGPNATRTFTNLAKYDPATAREIILRAYKTQAQPYLLNAISVLKLNDSASLSIYRSAINKNELSAFALQGLAQAGDLQDSKTFLDAFEKAEKSFRGRSFRLNLVYTEALAAKNKGEANNHLTALKSKLNKNEIPFITGIASVDFKINGVSDAWLDSLPKENIHTQIGILRLLKSAKHPRVAEKLEARAKAKPNEIIYMEALAAINSKKAAPIILSGLNSSDKNTRTAAAKLAVNYGDQFAASLLKSFIQKGSASGEDTAMAKSMVSSKNIQDVVTLWENLNPSLNLAFIEITGSIQNNTVAKKMIKATKNSDKKVQKAALKSLKNVVSPANFQTLKEMLNQESSSSSIRYLQAAVAESISLSDEGTVKELFSSLYNQRNDKLLVAFAKSNRPEVLPLLKKDLQSGTVETQKDTIKTLSAMSPNLNAELLLLAIEKCADERNRILAARALAEASVNGTASKAIRRAYLENAIKLNLPEKEKQLLKSKIKSVK